MPGFVAFGLCAALAAAGLITTAWILHRRLTAARAEAAALRDAAAARERAFGLLAREMQALGLGLLGHADARGPGAAAAAAQIAESAQRLLALSAELTELLAAEGPLRVVHARPLPLLPVIEEAVAATAAQLGPARRDWRLAPEFAGITLSADARASTCSSAPRA